VVIGILSDSHGDVVLLNEGIEALRGRNADVLIHLGDMIDTLRLETVDECVELLVRHQISGVMGNHEYSLIAHHFKRYPRRFSEISKRYISSLPRRLELYGVCFTHFSPDGSVSGLFAATDEESYEETIRSAGWPVVINGHSHDPRIYCQMNGIARNMEFTVNRPFHLEATARYILTCGALADSYCALFESDARWFEVIAVRD